MHSLPNHMGPCVILHKNMGIFGAGLHGSLSLMSWAHLVTSEYPTIDTIYLQQLMEEMPPIFFTSVYKKWGISLNKPRSASGAPPLRTTSHFSSTLGRMAHVQFQPLLVCHPETNFNVSRPLLYNSISITIPACPCCSPEPGGLPTKVSVSEEYATPWQEGTQTH